MSQRSFSILAIMCVSLASIAWSRDGGWNTARATLVADAPPTPDRITLVGGIAMRDDITLRDGTIEADIDAPSEGQFAGIAFRVQSAADYELVYFAGSGGRWQEIQYQPLFQGEPTWQLYPGPGYLADLPEDKVLAKQPLHVRIVFADSRADVYINGMATPVLRIPELKRAITPGRVGVWTKGADGLARMSFANFKATTSVADRPLTIAAAKALPGQLMKWRVSARMESPNAITAPTELASAHRAALASAKEGLAESDGLVNLSRIVGNPAGPQIENVPGGAGWGLALATTTIHAASAHPATLHFGYSEGMSIFLNGVNVFSGTHPYASPDIGRIIDQPNTIDLALRAGDNELVLAVTDRAFGWGFRAMLDDNARAGTIDLAKVPSTWKLYNRAATSANGMLVLDDRAGGGHAWTKSIQLGNGDIDVDVRGRDVAQKSFLGVLFHVAAADTFETVWLRPFNFTSTDSAHHAHAVQYASYPDHGWDKLRVDQPGKFEAAVPPGIRPDAWVHVHVEVRGSSVQAFLNGSSTPVLSVQSVSGRKTGGVGLWVGDQSPGDFANLVIRPTASR